jgi:hypothetical protein
MQLNAREGQELFLFSKNRTGSGAHAASLLVTGVLLLGDKAAAA